MTKEINNNLRNQEKIDDRKNDILLKGSNEIESQISNIVNVISQGFVQEGFKIKMEYLKKRKSEIEVKLLDIESREVSKVITEASVRTLLYNGTSKKISIFEPKLPIDNAIVFFNKYLFLLSFKVHRPPISIDYFLNNLLLFSSHILIFYRFC